MPARRDPFDQMEELFEQMRRSMTDAWGEEPFPLPLGDLPGGDLPGGDLGGRGATVERTDDGYVVLADIPGFEREDIELNVRGRRLTISASNEVEDEQVYRNRQVRETVTLPADALVDEAEATYRNGVLEVTFPSMSDDEDSVRIDVD